MLLDGLVVDVGAVGGAQVPHQQGLARIDDLGVVPRDRFLVDLDLALGGATHHHRLTVQVVFLAQLVAIDDDQTGLFAERSVCDTADRRDDSFGPDMVGIRSVVGVKGLAWQGVGTEA